MEFPVYISNGGEITVDYDIEDYEKDIIAKAIDDGELEFSEIEELSSLYENLKNEDYDEMANGIFDDQGFIVANFPDGYDFKKVRDFLVENYNITIDYPEL